MSNYFSFLVCHHNTHVDFFLNGMPLGVYKEGKFIPHQVPNPDGTKRDLRFNEIPKPHPFLSGDHYTTFISYQLEMFKSFGSCNKISPARAE